MIRQLTPDDLAAFRRVWLDGLTRFPSAFLLTPEEAADITDDQLLAGIEAGQYWGGFLNGSLAAIAAFRRGTRARARHSAEFGPLYVLPAAQGRGLARDLIENVASHARADGVLQMELAVEAGNAAAIALYRSCGFEDIGRRPRAVILDGQPMDDLLMLRMLDAG